MTERISVGAWILTKGDWSKSQVTHSQPGAPGDGEVSGGGGRQMESLHRGCEIKVGGGSGGDAVELRAQTPCHSAMLNAR
jgi:hypothetical protein